VRIGIETNTGHVFEGANAPQFPVWPPPVLTQASLITEANDWTDLPLGLSRTPLRWLFREDTYDPVTRIRRGRLYEPLPGGQPQSFRVRGHPFDHDQKKAVGAANELHATLYAYWPCQDSRITAPRALGKTLALGHGDAVSAWRLLEIEHVITEDIMVTLKAQSAYGIVPQLDLSALNEQHRRSITSAIERVLDAAFRESAISVIDHCRNAAAVVLARWMVQRGADPKLLAKDLADLVKSIAGAPFNKLMARDAAEVIRRLHPRGKANEQESKDLRVPTPDDAEFALHALGLILRELALAN
jgi:hypothetical protein